MIDDASYYRSFFQLVGDLEELKDKVYIDNETQLRTDVSPRTSSNNSMSNEIDIELGDLEVISTLGVGGFGRVELVKVFL